MRFVPSFSLLYNQFMKNILSHRKSIFYILVALLTLGLLFTNFIEAVPGINQSPSSQHFLQGEVTDIIEEGTMTVTNRENIFQEVRISFTEDGQQKEVTLTHGGDRIITPEQTLREGQKVVLSSNPNAAQENVRYHIWDQYRLPNLLILTAGFFILVLLISGKKGLGSILGLGFSFLVIIKFIVPLIMAGQDPLLISIAGSLLILSVSIYLAHGLTEQTSVAVVSTFLSLIVTGLLSVIFVRLAHLSGLGSEDAYSLQVRFNESINFQGLLLGGIIIGALGVLDDVTTAQSATVYELARTDKRLEFKELVRKGMNVGREHITSLVNTLVLAYAGASIGVFIYILLGVQTGDTPLWVILNSETLIEEVVRTLAGSVGLILAVPITTILAAFLSKYSIKLT